MGDGIGIGTSTGVGADAGTVRARYAVGYTQGVFDLFHIGHLNLIRNARAMCDQLIVGVNSDELVAQYKGQRPVIPEAERLDIVQSLRFVDRAEIVHTLDKAVQRGRFAFDALFIGDDWKGNERWEKTAREMRAAGVEVVFLPYTQTTSSTVIRRAITLLDEEGAQQ